MSLVVKLESPVRLRELAPVDTLRALGLVQGKVFCDIGAGTGVFTFAVREITDCVFSLEMNDAMLAHMQEKAAEQHITGISFIKTTPSSIGLPPASCDIALLCTVLHELTDAEAIAENIHEILKDDGLLGVIEFHKVKTPIGPPVDHRIAEADSMMLLEGAGLKLIRTQRLGENFYFQIFKKGAL